jgi:DNA-binding transcriptional ArsR family regulator
MVDPTSELLAADPLALRVCTVAKDAARAMSAYQLGQVLDRPQASLTRPLNTLTEAGALHKGIEVRRGMDVTVYCFDDSWRDALWEALRKGSLGQLRQGCRLILVASSGIEAAAQLLRDEIFLEQVAWISEFEDSRLALAIALREDVDPSVLSATVPALRRLGLPQDGAIRLVVGRTLDQPDVAAWIGDILEGPTAPQLPAASK